MMALPHFNLLGAVSPLILVSTAVGLCALFALIVLVPLALGMARIRETQVGIVVKKFSGRKLPPGHLIALDGEAGY